MNKRLKSISFLMVIQIVSYMIPIVEIPLLSRALGATEYGKLVLVQSVAVLCSFFIEYGFTISAARQVAISDKTDAVLAKIYSDVLSAKIILCVVLQIAVLCCMYYIGLTGYDLELIAFGLMYVLAFSFSPLWFFQGLEKLFAISMLDVGLRILCLVCLVIFIKQPADIKCALAIMSGLCFLNTVFSNCMCGPMLRTVRLSMGGGLMQIKTGFNVFMYKGSNNILLSSGPLVVAHAQGQTGVAVFVPAEKIIRGVVGILTPILTVFFPYVNRQFHFSKPNALMHSLIVVFAVFVIGLLSASSLYFAASTFVSFFSRGQFWRGGFCVGDTGMDHAVQIRKSGTGAFAANS